MSSTVRCTNEAAWRGTIAQGKIRYDWNYILQSSWQHSVIMCYMSYRFKMIAIAAGIYVYGLMTACWISQYKTTH